MNVIVEKPSVASVFVVAVFIMAILPCSGSSGFSKPGMKKAIDPKTVYILAVGCCPPWKPEQKQCRANVDALAQTFVSRMGVPETQIKKVVDAEATGEGVTAGFKWLENATKKTDTVIFYYNGHGGRLADPRRGPEHGIDEIFCLWSEKFPFTQQYAVWANIWMTDDELAELIHQIPAKHRVLIMDTCHADTAEQHLFDRGEKTSYELHDEALLAAAEAKQFAMPTLDNRSTLFTFHLLNEINLGAPDLKTAFERARPKVMADSEIVCVQTRKKYPKAPCEDGQTPALDDPRDITPFLKFRADDRYR